MSQICSFFLENFVSVTPQKKKRQVHVLGFEINQNETMSQVAIQDVAIAKIIT